MITSYRILNGETVLLDTNNASQALAYYELLQTHQLPCHMQRIQVSSMSARAIADLRRLIARHSRIKYAPFAKTLVRRKQANNKNMCESEKKY